MQNFNPTEGKLIYISGEVVSSNLDQELIKLLDLVNHKKTYYCIKAERSVLKILEGDCETAVGAFASIEEGKITLEVELSLIHI